MFSGKDKSKEKDSKSKDGKDSGGAKDSKHFSGGNHQRESFNKKASESKPEPGDGGSKSKPPVDTSMDGGADSSADSEEPKTTITHHADGTHTTEHSDGEVSDHPSMDDAAQYMSAKHGGMGMDPMGDMSQMIGPDGGNGAMEQAGGHGMPMGIGKRSTPSLY